MEYIPANDHLSAGEAFFCEASKEILDAISDPVKKEEMRQELQAGKDHILAIGEKIAEIEDMADYLHPSEKARLGAYIKQKIGPFLEPQA